MCRAEPDRQKRKRQKGEGAKVTSSRAACSHGAGEKLWESKQHRRIQICVQPLAALKGDCKDECTVVAADCLWDAFRIKGSPGSA